MPTPTTGEHEGVSLFAHLRAHMGERFEVFDCTKATLVHVSHTVEDLILRERMPAILLTGFQESSHWREETERYRALAEVAQQVCIFAGGRPGPDSNEREIRVTLVGDDPLRQEWFVCALTPQLSFVLCGLDRHVPAMEEATRQFQTFWTFEPDVVAEVLDLLEGAVARYRPDRLGDLRRARESLPPARPDARLMSTLLREMVRFEDQLQRTIREREARYKIVSELTTDFVYTVRVAPDGRLAYEWAADALARLAGYGPGELPPEAGWAEIAHPEDAALVRARAGALLGGREDVGEFRIRTRAGDTRWVRDYARPIADRRTGRVGQIIGAAADITEQKRVERELTSSVERLRALADASRLFAEAGADEGALLERIVRATTEALGAECGVELLVDEAGRLRSSALHSTDPGVVALARATLQGAQRDSILTATLREALAGRPLLIPALDRAGLAGRVPPQIEEAVRRLDVASVIAVPLPVRGQPGGALIFYRRAGRPFGEDDLRLARDLADRAALALGNIRLYTALQRANAALEERVEERTAELRSALERTQALYDITNDAIASDILVDALQRAIERACAAVGADRVLIVTLDWETRSVEHFLFAGRGRGRVFEHTSFEELMGGLTGWAIRERRPAISPKGTPDPREAPEVQRRREQLECGSIIVLPLVYLGEVFGTLTAINRPEEPDFTAEDVDLMGAIAGQIALAYARVRLTASLRRANRAKDEFLANMSHELRTPLNAILGYTESLHEEIYGPLAPRQRAAVESVQSAGRHLLTLINDILDLAKVEAGRLELQPERVRVADVCQASLLLVREQALKKRLRLSVRMNDHEATVVADAGRLRQMLVNLLSNAVKFTPEDGSVGLEAEVDPAAGVVRFSVEDTGIGIAPDDLRRLFQPFVQLDAALNRAHEGTGLGLALVRRLAGLHGGSVSVESAPGAGSRFTITLPAREAPPQAPPAAGALPAGDPATAPARGRVLIAEDNPANVGAFRDMLRAKGFEVFVAGDGREALALAAQVHPDVILMDIQMPRMSGLDAIRELRASPAHAATPVIAVTALAMPGDEERCLAAGATAYMTKPVSLRALLERIEQLLGGRGT